MLYPSMQELLGKINNRYLLVNIVAKRARDLAQDAEDSEIKLQGKPVSLALEDVIDDKVEIVETY